MKMGTLLTGLARDCPSTVCRWMAPIRANVSRAISDFMVLWTGLCVVLARSYGWLQCQPQCFLSGPKRRWWFLIGIAFVLDFSSRMSYTQTHTHILSTETEWNRGCESIPQLGQIAPSRSHHLPQSTAPLVGRENRRPSERVSMRCSDVTDIADRIAI